MEICLGMAEELIEHLWVWNKRRAGTADIIEGVCFRPPDQEDQVIEVLWWFYPAAQLNSTITTVSLPFLKRKGGKNIMKWAQGLR